MLLGLDRAAITIAPRLVASEPTLPPIAHTRFCLTYPEDCKPDDKNKSASADSRQVLTLTPERRAELEQVNASVNKSIVPQPQSESPAFEKWQITPAVGDCNDYVVTKRHQLLQKGWPSNALLMTEVELSSGEHHLVLVARTNEGDLVLDNLRGKMRTVVEATREYRWVRMESPKDPKFWNKVELPS